MADRAAPGVTGWWQRLVRERLRTRLMGAFVALLVGAVALTAVGWWGMQRTQSELRAYETEVLPQIARALEIAERISRLAATAPNMADSRTPAALEANAGVARSLLDEIRQRSSMVDARGQLAGRIAPLIERGEGDINRLTELAQTRQQLRDRLLRQLERLEQLGSALKPSANAGDALLAQLWSSLVLGASSSSATTLGRIEADVEGLLLAAHERGAFAGHPGGFAQALQGLTLGEDSILALRRRLVDLDNRTDALVALTRSNADRLSDIVSAHVDQLRGVTQSRSALVRQALTSGQTGLLLLTLVCGLIAIGSTVYVHRLVAQVEKITGVMQRLAGGDTAQATPATTRRDELGALARTFEVFRDHLLARQQLVAELRGQGELLGAVHNSMNDGLAVFDSERRLRLWNPALQRMLAQHGLQLQPGDPPERLLPQLPAQARWRVPGQAEHQPFSIDLMPPFAEQAHVELLLPGQRVYDVRSQSMPGGGVVSLVTDLTERRAIETQLQHAMRLDMLGRLTGGVAHDFHNHLGTIVGNLGLLQGQEGLDDKGRAQLARCLRAAERATALTRRLLAFARRQPLQAEWVAVDSMVEEMADLIEYSAGAEVKLALDLRSDDAAVYLDRGQLENALLNLVINSAAAMPSGGELSVRTRRRRLLEGDHLHDEVTIEVADTGCGIPEALQDKVFEPFFTTKQGGGDAGEGSGLGLSIVHGFVHQSGGQVLLKSRVGLGTSVTLSFPVADMRLQNPPQALLAPTATAATDPLEAAGTQVLLVDDDDAFRATVGDMLRQLGCTVQAVATPEQALQALETMQPDVMLSDVRLAAGADGRALARQVRERWPQLPIGLMSGVPREALEQSRHAMHWPFLLKPFDRERLARWLHEVKLQQDVSA
ncbi:ATP-binding protein [Ideonella sp. BN130291]|uniref:ATP-binding protein n=1 Tax=Ideonella sp. BN130291 TaxID=3112940 RepID=UPI002E25A4F9|nr:ATP-binding protein [Ideonella sp. BN130291]